MKTNKDVLLLRLGMLFLIAFFAMGRWFLRPQHTFDQGLIDGMAGCFLGVAIGCMVWSIVLERRRA